MSLEDDGYMVEDDEDAFTWDDTDEPPEDEDAGGSSSEPFWARVCRVCHEPFFETGRHWTCAKCRQRAHRARLRARQVLKRAAADTLDTWAEP